MGLDSFPAIYQTCFIVEEQAIWVVGDQHLQQLIPKFLRNKHHYPELSVFSRMEYSFDKDLQLQDVQLRLLEMFQIHDHLPQVILLVAGINNVGKSSKAQVRTRCKDMITDCSALWAKACPDPKLKLGLFVSLVPLCLWYPGYLGQRAGRDARRSLNSHIGKTAKMLQAVVVPHPHLSVEEKWFHNPQEDPVTLLEPDYDLFLQDVCLAIVAKLHFSSVPEQRETARMYWHQAPPPVPEEVPHGKTKARRHKKRPKHVRF